MTKDTGSAGELGLGQHGSKSTDAQSYGFIMGTGENKTSESGFYIYI